MVVWQRFLSLMINNFFFNGTATTEIYTLSLHDALPICHPSRPEAGEHLHHPRARARDRQGARLRHRERSEEHTSELQSRRDLVCRLLLEKKNTIELSFYYFQIHDAV